MINKIEIVRGTTNPFSITVHDESGAIYALGSDEKIVFGVKRDPNDADFVVLKTAEFEADEGVFVVTLVPEDTLDLPCGTYYYDVGLQSGAHYFNIIKFSKFELVPNITRRGCVE